MCIYIGVRKVGLFKCQNEKIGLLSFENMGFIIGLYLAAPQPCQTQCMFIGTDL